MTKISTQELVDELRSWRVTNIEHRQREEYKYIVIAADRLSELEKLSSDLIAENAKLKNAMEALTSDESVRIAFLKIKYTELLQEDDIHTAITAARKFVLEGKS